jgi:hypothetical protein
MTYRLKIDLNDLETAFESSDAELNYYLDLESGELLMVTDEISSEYERLRESAEESGLDFAQVLAQSKLPDWMKEAVLEADRVESGFGVTIIGVESDDSSDAFRDMEEFAESVGNPRLRQQLFRALDGPRPFRRFKDVISAYPSEEERWFAYRDAGLRRRMLAWLASEDIELIEE